MKMFMKITLPKMGELLVMMMTMISPSEREVPSTESLHRRAKVLLPQVLPRDGGASSRKLPPDFFQVKTHHIAEDVHWGPARWPTW